jgi:hypothetical protein
MCSTQYPGCMFSTTCRHTIHAGSTPCYRRAACVLACWLDHGMHSTLLVQSGAYRASSSSCWLSASCCCSNPSSPRSCTSPRFNSATSRDSAAACATHAVGHAQLLSRHVLRKCRKERSCWMSAACDPATEAMHAACQLPIVVLQMPTNQASLPQGDVLDPLAKPHLAS